MRTDYVILIHDDETAWTALAADPARHADRRAQYTRRHDEFVRRAAAEGHTITAGGELGKTADARVVRPGAPHGAALVTDGPYAELAEQVGGYYAVTTDDVDGLLRVLGEAFAGSPEIFEVRATVSDDAQRGPEPVGTAVAGAAS